MAVGIVDRQKLVNIADAVRAKKGITGNMTLDAIASNITSIPTADNNAKFDFSVSKSEGNLMKYLTTVNLSNFDTSSYTSMYNMFSGLTSIKSLDVSNLDTSNVTDMSDMFNDCSSLLNIDLSKNNLNKVKKFNSMFGSCKSLESLKISAIGNDITNVEQMFINCWNIKSIDLSNFRNKTTSQISVYGMFNGCTSVESIDISGMDFSKTHGNYSFYGMSKMFADCKKLKSIIFPSNIYFDNSKISMELMFYNCSSLTSLDLSGWDTSKVTIMDNMFNSCYKLSNLTLGTDWASNSSISSFDLSSCPLTRESAVDVINKLATRSNSPVIKFNNEVGLYQSEIDVATNKGWSVSGCTVLVEDATTATVGQYALIDGVLSKCTYVADTPQDWGQRVFIAVSSFTDSNGNSTFEWGGFGTVTGINNDTLGNGLSDTNALIAMNLQSSDGTPTVWDAIAEFRSTHSDRWFIPKNSELDASDYPGLWLSIEVSEVYAKYRGHNAMYNNYKTAKTPINPAIYV